MANLSNDKILSIMDEYKLDAELVLVMLLLVDVDDTIAGCMNSSQVTGNVKRYFNSGLNRRTFGECIEELKKRDILGKPAMDVPSDTDVNTYNFSRLEMKGTFRKKFFAYSMAMGEELLAHYPKFGYVNDKEVPLVSIKKCNSEDELFFRYAKMIRFDINKHKHIISLIDWAREYKTSFVNMNLESFILGRVWDAIEEFKEGGNEGYDVTYKSFFKCV